MDQSQQGEGARNGKGGGLLRGRRKGAGGGDKAGSSLAPNRAGILVARYLILGTLGILSLTGLMGIIGGGDSVDPAVEAPRFKPFIAPETAEVAASVGERFLALYLDTNPGVSLQRRDQLNALAPSLSDVQWVTSLDAQQTVLAGPYVVAEPVPIDPDLTAAQVAGDVVDAGVDVWSVTAAALIKPGKGEARWVNVSVAVSVSRVNGYAEVTGIPAFLPAPVPSELVGPRMYGRPDQDLAVEFGEILTGFFPDWARSDTTRLGRWLSPTATEEAQAGLAQTVSVEQVGATQAYSLEPGAPAYALVTVQWNTAANTTYPQQYLVTFVQIDGGRWAIDDISSFGFSSQ